MKLYYLRGFAVALTIFSSGFLAIDALAEEEAVPITFPERDLCVVAGEERNKRDAQALLAGKCDGENVLKFTFNDSNYLETDGRCLDYQEEDVLWLYDCSGHVGKEWRVKDGQFYNPRTKQCMGGPSKKLSEGDPLQLTSCKAAPQIAFATLKQVTVARLLGVKEKDLPGLGTEAFTILEETREYLFGEVMFAGVPTKAYATRFGGAKNPSLVLVSDEFDITKLLPEWKNSPLEKAKLSKSAITVIMNDGADEGVDLRSLPDPLRPYFEAQVSEKGEMDFSPGLNLYGVVEAKSRPLQDLLKVFGVRKADMSIAAQLSPLLVTVDHQDDKSVSKLFRANAKDILAQTRVTLGLPKLEIPHVDKLVAFERAKVHITPDDLPELTGGLLVKIPGHDLALDGTARLSKEGLLYLTGTSSIELKRALGLPFLDLKNVGVSAVIGVGNVEVPRSEVAEAQAEEIKKAEAKAGQDDDKKVAKKDDGDAKDDDEEETIKKGSVILELFSTAALGGEEIRTTTELQVVGQKITDFSIGLDGDVDIGKIDGFKEIPGLNEFAFSNVRLASWGAQGEVTWTRTGLKGRSMLMLKTDKKKADGLLMMRLESLRLGTLIPNLPKDFAELSFGESMLYFSDSAKDGVTVGDLPEFAQSMLAGIEDDADADVPIYDGVGLIGALGESSIPKPLRDAMKQNMDVYGGVKGPLIMQGALGNLLKGKPNVTIAAKLPKVVLPKNQPLAPLVSFDEAGAEFFLRLLPTAAQFQFGVAGDMLFAVPRLSNPSKPDKLKLRGEILGNIDVVSAGGSVKLSGQMNGRWNEPFGLYEDSYIEDVAIVAGVDADFAVEVGAGGNFAMTIVTAEGRKTIAAQSDFIANVALRGKIPTPKKLGVRLGLNEISLNSYIAMMEQQYRGLLTGPLAQEIVKSIPGPQQPLALDLQKQLRNADLSLETILQLDKLPIPIIRFRDVEIFLATPGATIPGRGQTMDTIGAVLAGKAEVRLQGKTHKIGETENRITLKDGVRLFTKLEGQDFGPIKFTDSHINLVASLTEIPRFEIKGSSNILGAKTALDVEITPVVAKIIAKQDFSSLFKFDFQSLAGVEDLKTFDDFAKADFRINASLKSDPQKWLQEEGLGTVKDILNIIGDATRKATDGLNVAKAEVDKLNITIEDMRAQVRRERRTVTDALSAAQREVRKLRDSIDSAIRARSSAARDIRACNQMTRICTIWVFGCRRHETVPDIFARAACEINNTPPRLEVVRRTAEIIALEAAKATADVALEATKRGASLLPVDADPRVAGPMAARDIAQISLDAAKLAVAGVAAIEGVINKGVDQLKVPASFKLDKAVLRGSLREGLKGKPVLMELAFTSFGVRFSERLAFSLTDPAFNARQMSSIALGIVTDTILRDIKRLQIIPHAVAAEIEKVFAKHREATEKEVQAALKANGDIQSDMEATTVSIAASIDESRQAREDIKAAADAELAEQKQAVLTARSEQNQLLLNKFSDGQQLITIRARNEANNDILCLEDTPETNERGATKIIFSKCENKSSQIFVIAKNGEVHGVSGRCLDYQEQGLMWLYTCTGHPGMKWEVRDRRLYNPYQDKCLRGVGSTIKAGTQAEIDRCQDRSAWAFSDGSIPMAVVTRNEQASGEICLQTMPGTNHRGAERLGFDRCRDDYREVFVLHADKTLRDLDGRCVDPQENDQLWLYTCGSGVDGRQWELANGRLKHVRSNKCVRGMGQPIAAGADAELDRCFSRSATVLKEQ